MGYGLEAVIKSRQIIDAVAEGLTLKKALAKVGLSAQTFSEVQAGVREIAEGYIRARITRSDMEVDEALEIADDSSYDPQQARNMIEIRKWRASKHNATVYGDKLEITGHQTISINDALADAKSRLILDAEVIPQPTLGSSVEPDIFS